MPSSIHSNSIRAAASSGTGRGSNQQDESFPWFSKSSLTIHNNLAETVVMSNDAWNHGGDAGGSDLLLTTVFAEVFDDKPRELRCLIDVGSTHSFISPLAIADKYWDRIKKNDPEFNYRNFKIMGATGNVV